MKGPRTYVGAALDEIARKRLRRARRAARTVDRDFHELDRQMAEIVYIEGHRTEAPYQLPRTELPYPDGPLASRKVDP